MSRTAAPARPTGYTFVPADPAQIDAARTQGVPPPDDGVQLGFMDDGRHAVRYRTRGDSLDICHLTDWHVGSVGNAGSWLPADWRMAVAPLGYTPAHLRRWFAVAKAYANFNQPAGGMTVPPVPSPRELVAHAWLILRHLIPHRDCPAEPVVEMNMAGCVGKLREAEHFIIDRLKVDARPAAVAATVQPDGPVGLDRFHWRGRSVRVSGRQYSLLAALFKNDDKTATVDDIMHAVYGDDDSGREEALRKIVSRLNEAFADAGVEGEVEAIRGKAAYRFSPTKPPTPAAPAPSVDQVLRPESDEKRTQKGRGASG